MVVAKRILGLDVVGGLYQPLGRHREKSARRPRGLVAQGRRAARRPRARSHRQPRARGGRGVLLEGAEAKAVELGAELRSGDIGRRPLNDTCPEVLHLPADLPDRAGDRPAQPTARTETTNEPSGADPRAARGDRGARPRRLPRGGRRHGQDPRAGRPLLRGGLRRRRRRRVDPRLHLHRARRRRAAGPGPPQPRRRARERRARPATPTAPRSWAATRGRPSEPG